MEEGRKKIMFVITKSAPFGGAQKYIYDLATSINKERFEPVVILGGKGLLFRKLSEKNIRTISIPEMGRDINISGDLKIFWKLLKIFRMERPEIIHLNSAKASGLGALSGRLAGVDKIIFTAHGWAFNEERVWWQRTIIKTLSWLTIILSHTTIAVSKRVLKESPALFVNKEKIKLVYNGVYIESFMQKDEAFGKLSSEKGDDLFVVGTISELHKNKGIRYAIEAVSGLKKKMPNLRYVIVGDGEELSYLQKLTRKYRLGKTVSFAGFIDEAPRLLRAFDAFLLPSTTEALGLSLLEAGLAGVPIIATSVGGVPEIIEDMKTGVLVRPRASREIGRAIEFARENPRKMASFASALREKVSEKFSLERMIKNTEEVYLG